MQGDSKCAAVLINLDGKLKIERNDIYNTSDINKDTQYRRFIEIVVKFLKSCVNENST